MKYKLIFMLLILTIPLVMAEVQTLGTFKQDSIINLKQICSNCTFCNITSLNNPNQVQVLGQIAMQQTGKEYNFTPNSNNFTSIGSYIVNGFCDEDGQDTVWAYDLFITTTGAKVSLSNIILVITFLALAGLFYLLGTTFIKEKWLLITLFNLSAMLMGLLAVNSARIIASESLNLSTMANSGFLVVISIILILFLYTFVLAFIEVIKQLKDKREIRWKY